MKTADNASWNSTGPSPATETFEEIPRSGRTVRNVWDRALKWGSERDFISFEGEAYSSYADFDILARKWTAALRRLGLEPGDRVAVMLPNCPEFTALLLGTLNSSLVLVPVNLAHRGGMLEHILADSGSKALIATPDCAGRIDPSWQLPALEHVVLVSDNNNDGGPADEATAALRQGPAVAIHNASHLTAAADLSLADAPELIPTYDTTAAVLYTSGTTGPSKGALVTQEFYVYYMWLYGRVLRHSTKDVLYTCLPMFHINAQVCSILPAVLIGARAVVFKSFSASKFWDQIADTGATHFAAIGTIGNILSKRPAAEYRPDHNLRLCQITPVPDDVEEFERRFNVPVYSGYGMTEGNFVWPNCEGTDRRGLIGHTHPYHEIAIVDDGDVQVPAGEIGEIVVRPKIPGIMFTEYLGRPEATIEATRNLWFHTGDLGMRDAAGDLWYHGRKKDAIRRRGENISAYEVEREAMRLESVAEAAAVGVKSDLGEEEVLLAVVAQDGARFTAPELHAFCVANLPAFMVPRYIDIREELPKNQSQRILKHELRAEGIRPTCWDAAQQVLAESRL